MKTDIKTESAHVSLEVAGQQQASTRQPDTGTDFALTAMSVHHQKYEKH